MSIRKALHFFATTSLFFPLLLAHSQSFNDHATPNIRSKSAIVMDAETGFVLYERDAHIPRHPASTTKIMTALLLVEHCKPFDIITAPEDCEKLEGSSLYLKPNEQVSAKDMLYALFLRSANDAAHSIACAIAGSDQEFAKLMNERAKQLGCKHTHFTNPHGLSDPKHYSTAYDLALITREAMKYPLIREAASSRSAWISRSINIKDTYLKSKNRFLLEPGAEGVKTGYTREAGHCFVGYKREDDWCLIAVVLDSEDWLTDTQTLYDWAYANYERRIVFPEKTIIGTASVEDGKQNSVRGILEKDFRVIARKGELLNPPEIYWNNKSLVAPVHAGDEIGKLVLEKDGITFATAVLAEKTIEVAPFWQKWQSTPIQASIFLLLFAMMWNFYRRRIARYK